MENINKQWLLRDISFVNDKGSATVLSIDNDGRINVDPIVSTGKIFFNTDVVELEYIIKLVKENIKNQREIFKDSTDKEILERFLSFEVKILKQLEDTLAFVQAKNKNV